MRHYAKTGCNRRGVMSWARSGRAGPAGRLPWANLWLPRSARIPALAAASASAVAACKAILDKWVLISQHFIQPRQYQDLTARVKAIQAKQAARAGQMVGKAFRPYGTPAVTPAAAVPL